jgi:hypothetical protein
MEPEVQKDLPQQEENQPIEPKHTSHTYADDLAKAMDATDAKVVQQIISDGREKEQIALEEKTQKSQKAWYKAGAIILILFTCASFGYGVYHYSRLTVPADIVASVGVFPSIDPILSSTTDIRKVVEGLKSNPNLTEGKPTLLPLVSNDKTLTLLTVPEMFSFFESKTSEPFLASFNIARIGVMSTGAENISFVITSVADPEISSKELLIAEPGLLQTFYRPLGIDISEHAEEIGKGFSGEYMYNIPVRALRYDNEEQSGNLLFFYAKVTDQIIVFTTKPEVLKAIYDSLIRQQ